MYVIYVICGILGICVICGCLKQCWESAGDDDWGPLKNYVD